MIEIINVADLPATGDSQGRTIRQVNAEKTHGIALHSLVELETGVRLFVVVQGRDCDQTPLYWLAPEIPEVTEDEDPRYYSHLRSKWIGGYAEEDLRVCEPVAEGGDIGANHKFVARPTDPNKCWCNRSLEEHTNG